MVITAAAVIPGKASRISDLAHLDGPIPDLLELSLEWVRRNTRATVTFRADGHGVDQTEIPLVAIRELVANALVHRDLSPRTQSQRVEIRLLSDRLVITNPGGLLGLSRDQLGKPGAKPAVNEFLYDICRDIRTPTGHRIIEGEGGGIREAKEALAEAGLREPVFVDSGVSFAAIIYRPTVTSPARTSALDTSVGTDNQQAVLRAVALGSRSIADVIEQTGLTRRRAKYALDRLVQTGRVAVRGGQGNRFTTYHAQPAD